MQPLWVRANLGVIAITGCSIYCKAPELEAHNSLVLYPGHSLGEGGVYLCAEMQSLYFTAPAVTYSYADACRNIFNTIKTSGHSSLEKYTFLFIRKGYKGYKRSYVWEVSWRLNRTAKYWPANSSGYNSISFPFSWAAQPGDWGPSLCWDMVLIPASSLQLIWTSSHWGYIIIWCPPTSCEHHIHTQFNPSTVKVIPWYLRPDAPVIYTGAFLILTARPGANMQHQPAGLLKWYQTENIGHIWITSIHSFKKKF